MLTKIEENKEKQIEERAKLDGGHWQEGWKLCLFYFIFWCILMLLLFKQSTSFW